MMAPRLRTPAVAELPALTELCLRSKGHWGYDAAFLARCRPELTLVPADLTETWLRVTGPAGATTGLVQLSVTGRTADLAKLFVDPAAIGQGLGRALFEAAADDARRRGAVRLTVESDPGAAGFYARMGGRPAGMARSGSIPGRLLPVFEIALDTLR